MIRPPVNDRPVRTALGRDGFARLVPVSRETLAQLEAYVELLKAWNRRINLVGATSLGDPWRRHILDSAQLLPHVPAKARLVDIGSGAGLPGLVLAAMGVADVHLIESDQKKAVFLHEAVRVTGIAATVHAMRSERLAPIAADVVTARAVAPLPDLLALAEPFIGPRTIAVFLKGRTAPDELTLAEKNWKMTARLMASVSDPGGMVLILESIARAPRP